MTVDRVTRMTMLAVLLGLMKPVVPASAEAATQTPQTDATTIQGEVVDPAAYLQEGRHGSDLAEQTYEAVDGGQTLALLEEGTDNLYLLLAEKPGEDPNELVYDYVNQKVKVAGHVYQRGGVRGVVVSTVTPLEAPKPPAPTAGATPAAPASAPAPANP